MTFEIRPNRQIPPGKRLNAERTKYFELVSQGYSLRGAAKIVGVNYRTTKRWRSDNYWSQQENSWHGRTHHRARTSRSSLCVT